MIEEITSEELLNKLSKVQLIDIREPYEYEEGHIEGSINIPMGNFLETVAVSALEIALPGLGAAIDKGRGFSQNPNAEMVFKSVPFRSFAFPYEFAPKNEKEKDEVQRIIEMFKFS